MGEAWVDGQPLLTQLLAGARKYGEKKVYGDAQLIKRHNRVTGVTVGKDHIPADIVIATTGAWMNELFQPLGIDYAITPQKAQIIHLQLPDTKTTSWPVVMPPNIQHLLTFSQ